MKFLQKLFPSQQIESWSFELPREPTLEETQREYEEASKAWRTDTWRETLEPMSSKKLEVIELTPEPLSLEEALDRKIAEKRKVHGDRLSYCYASFNHTKD